MNLTWLDGRIVAAVFIFMVSGVYISKNFMRSAADFLAAGRMARRYLVSVGQWIAGLGRLRSSLILR